MIWPYHASLGTPGHALVPALSEAIAFHAAAGDVQPTLLLKGSIAQTDIIRCLSSEVKVPGHPQGDLNTEFLDTLAGYDLLYIAGQAKSHCVLATMRSVMGYFRDRPDIIAKLRFLSDCTSSSKHPAIDFDALANAELTDMARLGMLLSKLPNLSAKTFRPLLLFLYRSGFCRVATCPEGAQPRYRIEGNPQQYLFLRTQSATLITHQRSPCFSLKLKKFSIRLGLKIKRGAGRPRISFLITVIPCMSFNPQ